MSFVTAKSQLVRFSVVGWRAEGPSGFPTPRLGGGGGEGEVPSLLLLEFSFSGDEEGGVDGCSWWSVEGGDAEGLWMAASKTVPTVALC